MKPSSYRLKFHDHEVTNNVVFYSISITDVNAQKSTWFQKARYSQIRALHNEIEKTHQGALPDFPPKKFFGNLELNFISQRKKHLENYFNTLLRTVNIEKVVVLRDFLFRGKKNEVASQENVEKPNENAPKPSLKKSKDEKEENNKELPHNSMIKATGGNIEKVVDFFTNKMVDITTNTSFPEEEEILKRRKGYEKLSSLKVKGGALLDSYRLPKGNERNLISIKKESKVSENNAAFKQMDVVITGIIARSDNLEEFIKTQMLVHHFE